MLLTATCFLIVSSTLLCIGETTENCTNGSAILELFERQTSSPGPIPLLTNGPPVLVLVTFMIADVPAVHISDETSINKGSSVEAYIYVSEVWYDPTLAYEHLNPCDYNITVPAAIAAKFWNPNLAFVSGYGAEYVKSPNRNTFMLLYPNGTVWLNNKLKVSGSCEIDEKAYPLEVARCTNILESYSYNTAQINLEWAPDTPIVFLKSLRGLVNFTTSMVKMVYPAGQWQELLFEFTFARSILVTCEEKGLQRVLSYEEYVAEPHRPCPSTIGRYADMHQCENCKFFSENG